METPSAPVETPAENENKIEAGTFSFTYVDVYGDETAFTVTTKDTGKVYVMYDGTLGRATLNGDGWTDNGDGTFTTNALSEAIPVDWVGADGKITWAVDGESVTPVGYTAPTEFIAKPYTDPTTVAEAVGVYTFGYVNNYGVTVPYVLQLNADGTFDIYENSNWVGLMHYYGDSWSINGDSVVALGPCSYDAEPPRTAGNGATWFAEGTYESTWTLDANKTCVPVGYEGKTGEIDLTTLPAECYPAASTVAGTYYFGFVNPYGATTPYAVKLKADGTALIIMDSTWVGAQSYAGKWTQNDDGTIFINEMTWEGEAPKTAGNGATWFADCTYESTWVLDGGKCVPANYDGKIAEIDRSTFSDGAISVLDAF